MILKRLLNFFDEDTATKNQMPGSTNVIGYKNNVEDTLL